MQQCRQCGRRLQDKLYKDDPNGRVCNACHKRRTLWQQSGRGATSVNNTFITEVIPIPAIVPDPLAYIREIKSTLADSLRNILKIQGPIKWYPASTLSFTKTVGDDIASIEARFTAVPRILLREDEIDAQLEESLELLFARADEF